MKIEAYEFGKMIYGGQTYTSDLIIYPGRVDPSWWRLKGHLLQTADLGDILKEEPDIIIIGTGAMGIMRVTKELRKQLEERNIELYVLRTGKAVEVFNTADKNKTVIGAFHLTC